jgi:hypothetical protein
MSLKSFENDNSRGNDSQGKELIVDPTQHKIHKGEK